MWSYKWCWWWSIYKQSSIAWRRAGVVCSESMSVSLAAAPHDVEQTHVVSPQWRLPGRRGRHGPVNAVRRALREKCTSCLGDLALALAASAAGRRGRHGPVDAVRRALREKCTSCLGALALAASAAGREREHVVLAGLELALDSSSASPMPPGDSNIRFTIFGASPHAPRHAAAAAEDHGRAHLAACAQLYVLHYYASGVINRSWVQGPQLVHRRARAAAVWEQLNAWQLHEEI